MGRKGGKYCMSGERLTGELVDPFIWTGGGGYKVRSGRKRVLGASKSKEKKMLSGEQGWKEDYGGERREVDERKEIQMGKWVIHILRETHSPEVRAHSPSSSFSVLRSTRRTIT